MPSKPRILAFDTSAAHCAAALLCDGAIVSTRVEEMGRGQAERLVPLLEEVLAEGNLSWSDLDAIGVGIGPGNFTGIRISVACARGLALGLDIPAVGISALEANVWPVTSQVPSTLDARRGLVYCQSIGPDGPIDAPKLVEGEAPPPPDPVQLVTATAFLAAQRFSTTTERPAPLYVRSADAAPPRDPAPVILDD